VGILKIATDHERIEVLVVDDHAVVRKGLRMFLAAVPDILVVDEAENGMAAMGKLASLDALGALPSVVLMDLLMPRMAGVEAIAAIRAAYPDVRVVALTSFSDLERVHAALDAGVSGYVLKGAGSDEIVTAVRAAARDTVYLDTGVARMLARSMTNRHPADDLSEREREVLRLVAQGQSNQDIADILNISERTARTHVSHVIMKLGLASRVQAALWAVRNGIITLS
jgi:DNA-binding NarL/FixJ family response regulator